MKSTGLQINASFDFSLHSDKPACCLVGLWNDSILKS